MKKMMHLKHEFVEYIPKKLVDGTIYVSMVFATAAHKCCCGCGNEVITPLSPTDWKLIFDGQSISLYPSIGNWNFECKSHYWINNNKVEWARRWSKKDINAGRAHDSLVKERYFEMAKTLMANDTVAGVGGPVEGNPKESLWWKLKKWVF